MAPEKRLCPLAPVSAESRAECMYQNCAWWDTGDPYHPHGICAMFSAALSLRQIERTIPVAGRAIPVAGRGVGNA